MSKMYKPQKIGGSIYLCIPPSFFSARMIEEGCMVELIKKDDVETIIRLTEINDGEHNKDIEAGGEDSSESRASNNIRKVG